MPSIYSQNLERTPANYQPLTPITFLERAASVYPNKTAVIYGSQKYSYSKFYERCRKLASFFNGNGISRGETISVLLANTPSMLEAHYAVPMCGGVLHSINTRLDASAIAFQLDHAETRILIADTAFSAVLSEALNILKHKPLIIDYADLELQINHRKIGFIDYEDALKSGNGDFKWLMPEDEWDAISVNYTSGTTGQPKGVVYHHRGAYLLAQGNVVTASVKKHATYLWTLPMFHCNGWCFPWSISVVSGTHICLREVRADAIWQLLKLHNVTHLCGAPIVMSTIVNAAELIHPLEERVEFFTAAAPPPEKLLTEMHEAGFNVTHLYGLTEVYGPAVINDWQSEWSELSNSSQATLKARQGVRYHALEDLDVFDTEKMKPVPRDGKTIGEVLFRGNIVMKGYLKNGLATKDAMKDGWFHSGDLGIIYPDGYIQLKDRLKDIIISGGENISSIEIEEVLYKHSHVLTAAVVAVPHDKWGETPFAFVELKNGFELSSDELRDWCRRHLAGYKIPSFFHLGAIGKTSTGKVQKGQLRTKASQIVKSQKKNNVLSPT